MAIQFVAKNNQKYIMHQGTRTLARDNKGDQWIDQKLALKNNFGMDGTVTMAHNSTDFGIKKATNGY